MFVNRLTSIVGMAVLSVMAASAAALLDVPLKDLDGKATTLGAYKGKVLLVVNVASQCGYTRQYKPLETVYRKYKDLGLVVIGVPSNDFGNQEPGTPAQIKSFCQTKYDISFPLMEKVCVRPGPDQHPLYAALTGKNSPFPGEVKWNFGKFLIGRNGRLVARFDSADEPDSPKVCQAIEAALASKEVQ